MLFNLGSVVVTIGANELDKGKMMKCLNSHVNGDWGNLDDEDKEANNIAVNSNNARILSKYEIDGEDIYIITEYDRSYTTIMLTSEY